MSNISLRGVKEKAESKQGYTVTPQHRHLQDLKNLLDDLYSVRAGAHCPSHTGSEYTGNLSVGDMNQALDNEIAPCSCHERKQTVCDCVNRTGIAACDCNVRTGPCNCQSRTSAASCSCNLRGGACSCDTRTNAGGGSCWCQSRGSVDESCNYCSCWYNCACNVHYYCDCQSRTSQCFCQSRTSAATCSCDVRTSSCVCASRTSTPTCDCDGRCSCDTVKEFTW